MSLNASVIIFPPASVTRQGLLSRLLGRSAKAETAEQPQSPSELETTARQILTEFQRRGFLEPGCAENAVADRRATFVTGRIIEFEPPRSLAWVHLPVDPPHLLPAISAIVYTSTQGEWWEGFQATDHPELLAVPYLDVTVFSAPVAITDADAKVVCQTWAVIEFSFEDARVSQEIHRIRNEHDPIFQALGHVLGSNMGWGVVTG